MRLEQQQPRVLAILDELFQPHSMKTLAVSGVSGTSCDRLVNRSVQLLLWDSGPRVKLGEAARSTSASAEEQQRAVSER